MQGDTPTREPAHRLARVHVLECAFYLFSRFFFSILPTTSVINVWDKKGELLTYFLFFYLPHQRDEPADSAQPWPVGLDSLTIPVKTQKGKRHIS